MSDSRLETVEVQCPECHKVFLSTFHCQNIAALEAAQVEKKQVVVTLRAWKKKAQGSYHEALEDVLSLMEEEMTDQERYQQAREAVANQLKELFPNEGFSFETTFWNDRADSLLRLTVDDKPLLAVLAENQMMKVQGVIPALDVQEVMSQLHQQGFRRVILPEEK